MALYFVIDENNELSLDPDTGDAESFPDQAVAVKRASELSAFNPGEKFSIACTVAIVRTPIGDPIITVVADEG